jgi:hypothetical protein
MSMQSFVQHLSASIGAIVASQMLSGEQGKPLIGMDRVGWGAVALAALVPVLIHQVEIRVRRREAEQRQQKLQA